MLAKIFKKIVFNLLIFTLFIAALSYSLMITYGYRLDTEKITLVEVGMADLTEVEPDAKVFLNSLLHYQKTPCNIYDLDIKNYQITLEKDGYYNWQKDVDIKENLITKLGEIKLIPKNPNKLDFEEKITSFAIAKNSNRIAIYSPKGNQIKIYDFDQNIISTIPLPPLETKNLNWSEGILKLEDKNGTWWQKDKTKWISVSAPLKKSQKNTETIITKDNEIWIIDKEKPLEKNLFSRFSSSVLFAKPFSKNQIIYAMGKNVHVCDLEKTNCYKIANYQKDSQVDFKDGFLFILTDSKLTKINLNKKAE